MAVATPDDPYPEDAPNNPAAPTTPTNPTTPQSVNDKRAYAAAHPATPRSGAGRADINPEWQNGWGPLGEPQGEDESFFSYLQRKGQAMAQMKRDIGDQPLRHGGIWGNVQGNRPGGFSTNPFQNRNRPGSINQSFGV
jgi:hypothetical protein